MTLTGPFTQLLTCEGLPARGALADDQLTVIPAGGVLHDHGRVVATGAFGELLARAAEVDRLTEPTVGLPGFVDCHTHLLWAGSRAADYAARNAGRSYQEIAAAGGGIRDTMRRTRAATDAALAAGLRARLDHHLRAGVTTVEVKTGYGLSVEQELRMLRLIRQTGRAHRATVVPTCLAAHVVPPEAAGPAAWLESILTDIVPVALREDLTRRFDIFVEEGAFSPGLARPFLERLRAAGLDVTVHGDQFTTGGSELAVAVGARSVDHLEVAGQAQIEALAASDTVAVALPGATLGLGCAFAPARRLLDAGATVAIASDWNPGSAPMGDLLTQAAILGVFERLTAAETLAGLTVRAAAALGLSDRGRLVAGARADFVGFPTTDYREVLYRQGQLKPNRVWKDGLTVT